MAGTIAAGLDGITNKILPPTKEEMKAMPKLSTNLSDALMHLGESEVTHIV